MWHGRLVFIIRKLVLLTTDYLLFAAYLFFLFADLISDKQQVYIVYYKLTYLKQQVR
jgi:hypothetical protein